MFGRDFDQGTEYMVFQRSLRWSREHRVLGVYDQAASIWTLVNINTS